MEFEEFDFGKSTRPSCGRYVIVVLNEKEEWQYLCTGGEKPCGKAFKFEVKDGGLDG